jgi:hypothetical protein
MTTINPKAMVIYREEKTKTWFKIKDVHDIRTEMNHTDGVTLVFNCQAFSASRSSGTFIGEMVLVQCHDHSTDIRYAAKVVFEYLSNENQFWVRANAREAVLPTIPLEWKNWVLEQNHMLHYTGKSTNINSFLALVTKNELTLENAQVLGSQTIIPLDSATQHQNWGRNVDKTVVEKPKEIPIPQKTWFQRLLRRA